MLVRAPVKHGDKTVSFILTAHFLERIRTRASLDLLNELSDVLLNSFVIMDRPSYLMTLLNHNIKDAVYLWNPSKKLVFVVEQSYEDNAFNAISTVYTARECEWISKWANLHPRSKRKKLSDMLEVLWDCKQVINTLTNREL